MRTLATDGLVLEPQTATHAEEMFAVLSDPAIYEYENEPPASIDWLRTRFAKLEVRHSPDGSEHWLNWVIRVPDSALAGYVQATVGNAGHAYVAYILSSAFWGRGLARRAVEAMIAELMQHYGVHTVWAIFKADNVRSRVLLARLAFAEADRDAYERHGVAADEALMFRTTR